MTPPLPDRSRDRRIEDPTNLWIIHPAGRALLPWFIARGVSANAVSVCGLVLGAGAALAYANWALWPFALLGLLLSVGWLIADGLDGMIARATGTASPLGRFLDGLCDHGVFAMIYIVLALSIGTVEGWVLAVSAGLLHAVQSSFYESERARFHRRCRGVAVAAPVPSGNPLVLLYDGVAGIIDRFAYRFDAALSRSPSSAALADAYGSQATQPMRLMRLLSANTRVVAIFLACLAGNPRLFWWFEIVPLTLVLILGLAWHRAVEARLTGAASAPLSNPESPTQRT
ncbi:CDP-alcohol phosphatidyltransferase family protein [Sphingomonas sp. M1-B02]|uniref:CDP-alcohol phosphatidyltransferase family protein n=1 Tax=Sphingomonas sp. M1-B02 TaxID=3114300 RepID=UPI0022402953|nr:CDP-alcohol phosphatidyltransferase family protein [Sphingomonas sp. S6-11]UZK65007.1 CDP-alcohol phosphatidyltransferase family protein [Sphingomonas sp. S6-11]